MHLQDGKDLQQMQGFIKMQSIQIWWYQQDGTILLMLVSLTVISLLFPTMVSNTILQSGGELNLIYSGYLYI